MIEVMAFLPIVIRVIAMTLLPIVIGVIVMTLLPIMMALLPIVIGVMVLLPIMIGVMVLLPIVIGVMAMTLLPIMIGVMAMTLLPIVIGVMVLLSSIKLMAMELMIMTFLGSMMDSIALLSLMIETMFLIELVDLHIVLHSLPLHQKPATLLFLLHRKKPT